ncbi:MAG: GNAT family N-acetyltransferase, partial [Bifidobacteriaceae bacterium]|nr:GNAT family N-acetyltransferase [Bifidobacteriaceae bacterium]
MSNSTMAAATVDTRADLPPWAHRVELGAGRHIREARPEEYPAAEDVLVSAFTTGCWGSPGYLAGLRRLAERAVTFHVWLALDRDDQILGVVLTPRARYTPGPDFTFSVLSVAPAGRGLGLGGQLVDHAIGLARAYGFGRIKIHSSPQMSRAHALYYAKGFARRIDEETIFVSEFEERLLTFTYRVPDPLPAAQVVRVERQDPPGGLGPFARRPPGAEQRAAWPTPQAAAELAASRAAAVAARLDLASATSDWLTSQIAGDIGAGLREAVYSQSPDAADLALRLAYARLDLLEARLARQRSPYLSGERPAFADALLFSLLLSFDLGQRAALGPFGAAAAAYWPRLWNLVRLILAEAGLSQDELTAAGLAPRADGTHVEPYGPLPINWALADP